MNWLYYLAEANTYLGVFYLCYCLFLNKQTHYTLNRIYLLFSCAAAFILPVMQAGFLNPSSTVGIQVGQLTLEKAGAETGHNVLSFADFGWQQALIFGYVLGALVVFIMLMIKLYQLFKLIRKQPMLVKDGYKVVIMDEPDTAFSFFNYLFIGANAAQSHTITRHEMVHIRQKHSVDIILLELFKIVNWFNPLVYLLQNSLKALHEYIADQQTSAEENDATAYSDFLINSAYGTAGFSITHSFFTYKLLKNRLIMLHQKPSGNLARLKYLTVLPLCMAMLCTSTLAFSKSYGWIDLAPGQKTVAPITIEDPILLTTKASKTTTKDSIYTNVDKQPNFPGGIEGFYKYLGKTIKYPADSREKGIQGKVILRFVVKKDGSITDVKVVRGVSPDIDKEAARAMAGSPKWTPGLVKGKAVTCQFNVPVSFTLAK